MLLGNVSAGREASGRCPGIFSKAIALKPNDPNAYLNRGAAYIFTEAG